METMVRMAAHGCACLRIPTDLQSIRDPIPFLQISSHKVCTGVLATNHKPIHKISVEQYICLMGHIFAAMGPPDPRLNVVGVIDFYLRQQFATYTK